ncbi:N-acetylglucosamine-6-phosphate deacetylase [Mariniluteicoccus endophyticus]
MADAVVDGALAGPHEVEVEGDRLVALRPTTAAPTVAGVAVPGFVDTHVHGGGRGDYASADPDQIRRARDFHLAHGTTTTFASLVTADANRLAEQMAVLARFVADGDIAGIHLEGPCLAHARRGAHEAGLLADPDPALVDQLVAAGPPAMVTLAPELPGGIAATERFTAAGTAVALGHCEADAATARAAIEAGVRVVTHLFNAMPAIHHREPGPVPVVLTDPRVTVELICDGHHVSPEVVALAVATAGPSRVALVTDAIAATGVPDGPTMLGNLAVTVTDGVARLDDGGNLAGSTLTMDRAFAFCVRELGLGLADAATMAATTPARLHGLDDVGELATGRRADLNLVSADGDLLAVMSRGRWVGDRRP